MEATGNETVVKFELPVAVPPMSSDFRDHGAVHGAGGWGQAPGMRCADHDPGEGFQAGPEGRLMAGRSSIERLPPGILADVREAIREGATIDDITGRFRALGGACSCSAVCRYVRRARVVL